ncbi:hypothetical protein HUT19_09400 [Streptomyces sp. NA02950]|uniref:hypothetical protein n=1 Tax=Streptomyces sp. NA02950 TaxID=2742137 RepID=UPI001592318F|nr:hypothetical protein [Streptomyces sp. NA02950]QKV91932.1 hypothetical protein HUT19_09400 [Streptomyces sp. NA02950]
MNAADRRPAQGDKGATPPGRGSGVPARPGTPGGDDGRPRRRWLRALVIFLLIAIPAGYGVISAIQSREGGENKEERASATGLTEGWPSRVQRRIYDVPIPPYSADVAFYETNSWDESSLYVQFITSREGLHRFLVRAGVRPSALERGEVTISAKEAKKVGWQLGSGKHWSGTVFQQKDPQPRLEITVNRDNPRHPKVYVVSTVTP